MPYKRHYRKKPQNKRRRKRYNRKPLNVSASNQTFPLPTKFKTKLRYVERAIALDPGVGGAAVSQVFSANGLYDPDVTGIGHQPLGFDQLMPLYDHYTVIASKITIEAVNTDATNENQLVLYMKDSSVAETQFNTLVENGNCKTLLMTPKGGSRDRGQLTMVANPNKFLGRSHPLSDDQLKGTVSSNPAEQCYWIVGVAPNNINNADVVSLQAIIEYTVIFSEPKILIGS